MENIELPDRLITDFKKSMARIADLETPIFIGVPFDQDPEKALKYSRNMIEKIYNAGGIPISPVDHLLYPSEIFSRDSSTDYSKDHIRLLTAFMKVIVTFPSESAGFVWTTSPECIQVYEWAKENLIPVVFLDALLEGIIIYVHLDKEEKIND